MEDSDKISENSDNEEEHQELSSTDKNSEENIQISLTNAPVGNGYIQIQQIQRNLPSSKPEMALIDSDQATGYSRVGALPSPGYIQFPGNSVVISPGLLEQSSLPRELLDPPRNTVV